MNALVPLEPIPLPDLRKPTGMPSLPGWLATQRAALAENLQITTDTTGKPVFRDLVTLPAPLLPNDTQRAMIVGHCSSLRQTLNETPENGQEWAAETMTAITKMMLVLGSQKASELAGEAKAEAYMVALEDMPAWAVVSSAKRWYRGQCGNDENGHPYDYRWMPDPATMRRLASLETYRVLSRIKELEVVLYAVPFVDCSSQLEKGRAAWDGLRISLKSPDTLESLTFDKAAEIGREKRA